MEKSGKIEFHEGHWLRALVAETGQSQTQFAKSSGVKHGTLIQYFIDERLVIRPDKKAVLARALGMDSAWAFDESLRRAKEAGFRRRADAAGSRSVVEMIAQGLPVEEADEFDGNVGPQIGRTLAEIPTFDLSLSAGPWSDVLDVPEICGPSSVSQGLFRVRIAGDSMKPLYKTGMIIEFECLAEGRHSLELNRDYYVQRDDGSATFKRLDKIGEEFLTLRALNGKKFPKRIIVERSRVVKMAVAKGEFRPFG